MSDCGESEVFLPFQQSAVYAAVAAACGARVRWLDGEGGPVLAVERGRLRLISRVICAERDASEQRRALRCMARWPGVTVITPERVVTGFGIVPLVTPMHHALWTLGPDLRAGMAGNWRRGLSKPERAGLQIQRGDRDVLEVLIQAEANQRTERRYRALPQEFSRALPDTALRVWQWRHDSEVQAAMAFVRHGASASYHLGWGSAAARAAGVHGLMLLRAAEALWSEGVRWLDLGSVDTERASGLARFKLGTGAELRSLGATCLVLP